MARWGSAVTLGLAVVGISVFPAGSSAQTVGQVGYVNTTTVLQQTPGFDAADSILTAQRAVYQQEADSLRAQLAAVMTAFDEQQLMLSPQVREERMTELSEVNDHVQTRLQEMQDLVLARQRELVAPLEQRIQAVIDGVRAERNLAIVFDVANPNSSIISADPLMDLTAFVISRLQAAGPPQNPL
ncbi:OmpH family outer membrane protein [Gemmatimonadota bacterium]